MVAFGCEGVEDRSGRLGREDGDSMLVPNDEVLAVCDTVLVYSGEASPRLGEYAI